MPNQIDLIEQQKRILDDQDIMLLKIIAFFALVVMVLI